MARFGPVLTQGMNTATNLWAKSALIALEGAQHDEHAMGALIVGWMRRRRGSLDGVEIEEQARTHVGGPQHIGGQDVGEELAGDGCRPRGVGNTEKSSLC